MATELWTTPSAWTTAASTGTLASLATANSVLSDVAITNTNGDVFCDVSFVLATAAFVAPNYVSIYVYPLNQDGSTYGDGRFATATAGTPAGNYTGSSVGIVAATTQQVGMAQRLVLPPKGAGYKFVVYNGGGVALATSGNALLYRTYDRSIA